MSWLYGNIVRFFPQNSMTDITPTQEECACFIKNVHAELRAKCQEDGSSDEAVWRQHLLRKEVLAEYAKSMHRLAREVWDERHAGAPELSRIAWTHRAILEYYTEAHLARARAYDDRLAQRHGAGHSWCSSTELTQLAEFDTLDVGSCYNPFLGLARLRVTACDLQPAAACVLRADLLSVPLGERTVAASGRLLALAADSWHAVCFCLLLEYLPTPALRYALCRRAASLLCTEGVLVVVSPDSAHRTANGRLYRGWKLALAALGLVRVRYEKLEHLHCMVFRKSAHPDLVAAEAREQIGQDAAHGRLVWRRPAVQSAVASLAGRITADEPDSPTVAGDAAATSRPRTENCSGGGGDRCDHTGTADVTGDHVDVPEPHQLMVIHQDLKRTVLVSETEPPPSLCDSAQDICDALQHLPLL